MRVVPFKALSLPSLLVVLASSTFACVGDSGVVADGGTPADGGDGGVIPGSDSGPTTRAIGGVVHFLQSGGTALQLSNGSDTLSVTAAGTFTFPKRASDGDAYDVKVVSSPAGQRCTLRTAGAGTVAAADVNVTIACTLARVSTTPAVADATTTSTTFADVSSIPAITFTTDVASSVLVALSVGALLPDGTKGSGRGATLGINVDGTVAAQGHQSIEYFQLSHGFTTYAVVALPAGTHAIKAQWKADSGATSAIYTSYGNNLSAVVLDSLGSFASAKSSAAALTASNTTTTDSPLGLTDISLTPPNGSVLALLHVPSATGTGTGGAFGISVSGNKVASASTANCGDAFDFTYSPAAIVPVAAAAQTVSAQWSALAGSTFSVAAAQARMDAIAFDAKAGGKSASAVGDFSVSTTTSTAIPSLGTVTLNPVADSQALVILQADDVYTEGNGQPGNVTLDMDGTTLGQAFTQSQNSNCARPSTIFVVTPVTAGPHTFTGKMNELGSGPIHVSHRTTLNAMLLE